MNIVGVVLSRNLVITDTDEAGRITTYFDKAGDQITDPKEAVAAIAAMPDGRFWVLDPREYAQVTLQ